MSKVNFYTKLQHYGKMLQFNPAAVIFSLYHTILQHHQTILGTQHGLKHRGVNIIASDSLASAEIVPRHLTQRFGRKADHITILARSMLHNLTQILSAAIGQFAEIGDTYHIHLALTGENLLGGIALNIRN